MEQEGRLLIQQPVAAVKAEKKERRMVSREEAEQRKNEAEEAREGRRVEREKEREERRRDRKELRRVKGEERQEERERRTKEVLERREASRRRYEEGRVRQGEERERKVEPLDPDSVAADLRRFMCHICLVFPRPGSYNRSELYRHLALVHFAEQVKEEHGFSSHADLAPCTECGKPLTRSRFVDHMGAVHGGVERHMPAELRLGPGRGAGTPGVGGAGGRGAGGRAQGAGGGRRSGRRSAAASYKEESGSEVEEGEEVASEEEASDAEVKEEKANLSEDARKCAASFMSYIGKSGKTKITRVSEDEDEISVVQESRTTRSGQLSGSTARRKPQIMEIIDDSDDDDDIKVELDEVTTRTRSGRVSRKRTILEVASKPSTKRGREEDVDFTDRISKALETGEHTARSRRSHYAEDRGRMSQRLQMFNEPDVETVDL
jgi:hypothetical protein